MAGLTAAERCRAFADVTLFERQRYDEKRVNCGEAINDASVVPLDPTPENGFLNRVRGFEVELYPSTDRDVVERRWAGRLRGAYADRWEFGRVRA